MSKTLDEGPAEPPGVQVATASKTFRLIAQDRRRVDLRNSDGTTDVVWRMENKKRHPARGRLEITAGGAADTAWVTIVGGQTRDFRSRETLDFRARISIPPETPAGTFEFAAVAVNEADPDRDFTENDGSSVTLDWEPKAAIKRVAKWKLVVALLLFATLSGVVGRLVYQNLNSEPRHLLAVANDRAAAADWSGYWDCWSTQGRHKLVYWQAYELRKEAAKNPRWRGELQAWLPSMGLTLNDLDIFDKPPSDVTAVEATELTRALLTKTLEHGQSGEAFFVTAAKWNQVTEQDEQDDKALAASGAAPAGDFITRVDMLNMFRFRLLCEVPFRQGTTSDVREYFAVTYRSMKAASENAQEVDHCVACSAIGATTPDGRNDSRLSQDALEQPKAAWQQYGGEAIKLSFVKLDGAWLLNDFRTEGSVKGETWHALSSKSELLKVVAQNEESGKNSLVLHFRDGSRWQADIEKLPAVDQDWQQSFLFVDRKPIDTTLARKIQHNYRFQLLKDAFLVVHKTTPNGQTSAASEAMYFAKHDTLPVAGHFLEKQYGQVAAFLHQLGYEHRFVPAKKLVDDHSEKKLQAPESLTINAVYVENLSGGPSNGKMLPIRKLNPTEHLPTKQTIYLELGD